MEQEISFSVSNLDMWSMHIEPRPWFIMAVFCCFCFCCRCVQPRGVGSKQLAFFFFFLTDWSPYGTSPRFEELRQNMLAEAVCFHVKDFGEARSLLQSLEKVWKGRDMVLYHIQSPLGLHNNSSMTESYKKH